jgi:Polyketide cyclase / dehydrase and lipid transport
LGEIVKHITVRSSPAHVYDYVADPHNAPKFISSITGIISGPAGKPEKGAVWRAEANFFGQKRVLNLRLDEAVAGRGVRFALDGDPQAVLVLKLVPEAEGKNTTVSLALDVPSVPSIFLNALLGNLLGEDMTRLKRNLESTT